MTFPQAFKQPLKETLGHLGRGAGLLPRLLRCKTLILAYHRVVRGDETFGLEPGMYVEAATFARHLDFLRRHLQVVPLAGFLAEPLVPEPRCVITFDDGWHDNYANAFPLLRQASLPATIFLTAGYVGTKRWLWSDKAAYLVSKVWPHAERLRRFALSANGNEEKRQPEFAAKLISQLKGLEPGVRKEWIERASTELGVEFPARRLFLDWDEAAEMGRQGISFGCHGAGHLDLSQLHGFRLEEEMTASLEALRELPGFLPVLSYPYGAYNGSVVAQARASGYEAAVTMTAGLNDHETNRFALRRISLHEDVSRTDGLLAFCILRGALAGPRSG